VRGKDSASCCLCPIARAARRRILEQFLQSHRDDPRGQIGGCPFSPEAALINGAPCGRRRKNG